MLEVICGLEVCPLTRTDYTVARLCSDAISYEIVW